MPFILSLSGALIASPLAYAACALTKRSGVVDAPDGQRKQQAAPVPRLGGMGIVFAIAIVFALAAVGYEWVPGMAESDWLPGDFDFILVALAIASMLCLIGAWDDIFGMTAKVKLALVGLICIAAPFLGNAVPALDTPFGSISLPAVTLVGSALWLIVFTNAANFMDGSNGLSIGSLGIMFAGLGSAQAVVFAEAFPPGLAVIIAAIAGFLVHNMKGTLYAGDCGAFGLGGLFATLALISDLSVWTVATLALPFLVDVLLTLIMRAKHGDAWFEAHTDHAYQALRKAGWGHWDVAVAWWGLSAACAVGAVIAASGGGALPFAVFWIFAVVLALLWLIVQRQTRDK